MIGQKTLLDKIDRLIDKYPKFSIIVGPKGSGKKQIVKYICDKLGVLCVNFGTGIDEVRKIIDLSYEQTEPICYVCSDADSMSLGAKNALLKITEEPPQKALFILTLESMSNTLETIQSRGTVLTLDPYTTDELIQFRQMRSYTPTFDPVIKDICSCTGDVDILFAQDVQKFYQFAKTVAYQIHIPTSGNIFKISQQVKSKSTDSGYDAKLLFKTVRHLYIEKYLETQKIQYLHASDVTSKCLLDLNIANLNVVATVDNWIIEVRKVLRGI